MHPKKLRKLIQLTHQLIDNIVNKFDNQFPDPELKKKALEDKKNQENLKEYDAQIEEFFKGDFPQDPDNNNDDDEDRDDGLNDVGEPKFESDYLSEFQTMDL